MPHNVNVKVIYNNIPKMILLFFFLIFSVDHRNVISCLSSFERWIIHKYFVIMMIFDFLIPKKKEKNIHFSMRADIFVHQIIDGQFYSSDVTTVVVSRLLPTLFCSQSRLFKVQYQPKQLSDNVLQMCFHPSSFHLSSRSRFDVILVVFLSYFRSFYFAFTEQKHASLWHLEWLRFPKNIDEIQHSSQIDALNFIQNGTICDWVFLFWHSLFFFPLFLCALVTVQKSRTLSQTKNSACTAALFWIRLFHTNDCDFVRIFF